MDNVLTRILRRQNAHSLYLTFAASVFTLTIAVDLIFHQYMPLRWLSWILLVFCAGAAVFVFTLGRQIRSWVGIVALCAFISAQTYYLGQRSDPQAVVSSVQQLPIAAFYLGWFVQPRLARVIVCVCLLLFGAALGSNPLVHRDGIIGFPVFVHAMLLFLFCYSVGFALQRRQVFHASIDSLTGALSRQGFFTQVHRQLARSSSKRPCTVVAIDFDGLKALNDRAGHAAGDRALQEAVHDWRNQVRRTDVVGRIGGDEFAILLPRTTEAEGRQLMARLQDLSRHSWSWGIAEGVRGESAASLFERADSALYVHKRERKASGHA